MKKYKYQKIDAFASGLSTGNPAACIFLEEQEVLTEQEMLWVAKQHKGFVSEVVYCRCKSPNTFHLTYYSSECEVDFCGHGTIACTYSLIKSNPSLLALKELIITTNKKGSVCVYNDIPAHNAVYIAAPTPTYVESQLASEVVADNLNILSSQIDERLPLHIIDAGLRTLIVPIITLEDEINISPNENRLKLFCLHNNIDIVLCFSMDVFSAESHAHTRVFAPKFGYLEDPATGSGNSAFGYYMLRHGLWRNNNIILEQGGKDIVFNKVYLSKRGEVITFGGGAVMRINGQYCL